MKSAICAVLLLSTTVPATAQLEELSVFKDDWYVAPSPDPERFRVENGSSLRFHGLLEVPYPASCSACAKTSYLIDEKSTLRLGFKRGKIATDSLHFRYGFAVFSRGSHIVLYHHLAPSWNGARGWTLQQNMRDADGNAEMQHQPVFRLRNELIASYPSKFSMPTFFDNPEDLQLELSNKGLTVTRNGESRTVAFEFEGEVEVAFFVSGDFFPIQLDFEVSELTVAGTPGDKQLQLGPGSYLASTNIVRQLKELPPVEEFDPSKAVRESIGDNNLLGVTLRGSWPTSRWYEYLDRSKRIGYNTISLDIPWGQVEREPGVFDFKRFDDAIAYAANRGYFLQLKPWWVRCSYPIWVNPALEQACHPADGETWAPQLTFADPELTARIARYSAEIAKRYRGYPNVLYTPVCGPSAEMEYSHGQYCDYGPVATVRFAKWLKTKYGQIAELNRAWGSDHADFTAVTAPHLGNKAERDIPDLDPAFLDFMAFREDMLKELMTDIHEAMRTADPNCQLGIQVGRTHDGPMLAKRGTPGIHYWAKPYEWIIADPQPQKRTDSAGYIVDFIRAGNKIPGVEQTTYESYADDPAVFWEFTWQVWQHRGPLMLIANCAPYLDAEGIHTSRRCAEQIREISKFDPPKTAMFVSKWELYAWHRGDRWLDCRQAYNRLTDNGKQVVDVINGDIIDNVPDLLERYDKIIVPYGDVMDEEVQMALTAHADKLVIESPEIFGQTVLRDVSAQEDSIRDWTVADFAQRGHVSRGPVGEIHEQLRFWDWQDNTLLDLRQSVFLALENGPFSDGTVPRQYPTGTALDSMRETDSHEKYPVSIKGRRSRNIVVMGGHIVGQQPRELPWRMMKRFYDGDGVRIEASGELIVDGTLIENVEDGFSPRGDGDWIIRNSLMRYIRDDFVENDGLLSGEINDCLADGVYVFLSARPGKNADPNQLDERQPPVVRIRNTLVHLQPMPYDGNMKLTNRRYIKDGKTCGMLFKWSRWAGTVDVADCIFRVDEMAASGPKPMRFPAGTYRNVTLVWLGDGEYPTELPEGVTISRDVELWNKARTAWLARHHCRFPDGIPVNR